MRIREGYWVTVLQGGILDADNDGGGKTVNKEDDTNVLYDENLVPDYTLPPLLETVEGNPVTTAREWSTIRRPQVLSLFSNLVYGHVPLPKDPLETGYSVIDTVSDFMDGLATRLTVSMNFSNRNGKAESVLQVFLPNHVKEPVPALLVYSFSDTRSPDFDPDPERPGLTRQGFPLALVMEKGFALVIVDQSDLVGHNEVEFGRKSIQHLFYDKGQSFPRAHEWGVISAIAWGGSRALDYLQTLDSVDDRRVAVMGHSKLGKAALWTAALDERFALVISAQSGAAGAALWRRTYGETLEKMVTRFPYWLCRNAWKFVGNEDDLPVDQHMLLALIAPRPLYVASGQDDRWADPRGEFLSAWHAGEVYRLFGLQGLASEASPPLDAPDMDGSIAYHVRSGGHSVELYDVRNFLDFATRHLGTTG